MITLIQIIIAMEIIIGFLAGLVIGGLIMYLVFKSKLVVIEDKAPARKDATSIAMQLSNELKPYFKEKDGKYVLTVLK